jgi:glycosyltransferase involved in cell wall biosynthesis
LCGSSTPPLTIGIDARAATEEIAGSGRVARELIRALAAREEPHRYRLYAHTRWDEPLDGRFTWALSPATGLRWHLGVAHRAAACDVLLSTNSYLTAWFARAPTVLEVYDLVAFEPALRSSSRAAAIERATLGPAVRRAAGFVCISQATADALTARFPAAAGRVTVAPLAVSPALRAEAMDLPGGFVLAVGTLEPRKNLPRLAAAYARLPSELQAAHPLLIAGRIGWDAAETLGALAGLGDRCRLLGTVPDAQLAALYERCTVFCYPSLAEGFGLPVLEAMAAGAAVITSDVSSLAEVGGDAVEYVSPTDTGSIAAALERLLRDPRRRAALSAAARERAGRFSWDRHAELTLRALERAGTRRAGRG